MGDSSPACSGWELRLLLSLLSLYVGAVTGSFRTWVIVTIIITFIMFTSCSITGSYHLVIEV